MGITSEQEHRLDSDTSRHAHVARTVSRLRDVFDWLMKPTERPRLVLSTQYTRCGALHPLRGATPDVGRYTRSEEVQCPRIGCSATFNKHFRGRTITPIISRRAHHHPPQALHPLRRAAPDVGRYTRCGALHPIRRGAMPTDRVQRPTQQAFSRRRATHLIPHRHTCRPHLEHLPLWV